MFMLDRYWKHRFALIAASILSLFMLIVPKAAYSTSAHGEVRHLDDQRELFVDNYLVDSMKNVHLLLHKPQDQGSVFRFDRPWEGQFCGYCTIIQDGDRFRLYYRGKPAASPDGVNEVTCLAESPDGTHWTRPDLELIEWEGSKSNNIILAVNGLSHNFSPMLDANPAARPAENRQGNRRHVGDRDFCFRFA